MGDFLKKLFNRDAPAPLTPVETLLTDRGVKYKKEPDGSLYVRRDLDLGFRKLESLPDLSTVTVQGNFSCSYNENLTSLAGAPRRVGGTFRCTGTSLSYVGPDTLSFGALMTDHGTYKNWDDIPKWLRLDDAGKRALIEATSDTAQLEDYLKWTIRTGDLTLARQCIDRGADINGGGGEPLMLAARRGNLDIAGMLCIAGADVDKAIKTARDKWHAAEFYDAGQMVIGDGPTHDYYYPVDMWLSRQAGSLREKVQAQKIEQLEQAKAGLEQRVAALQAAEPAAIDKPKIKPPAAF